ncbi:DUF4432 family protein [Herbiconiux sp. P18]|uniref:DUF4432 family protein n=1 Tax=Herbiconiux liangxiaofengii TaxID=3342795 RepID=UPI0035BA8846
MSEPTPTTGATPGPAAPPAPAALGPRLAELHHRGLLASRTALARATERLGLPGGADHARVIETWVAGGFDLEVLPARGLDLGRASVGGIPVSWTSPVTDARPLDHPTGEAWVQRFTGGLLVTCGVDNVGPATDTAGLHGSYSHRPAVDVRSRARAEPRAEVRVHGAVEAVALFGPSLRVERRIVSDVDRAGRARVRIRDVVHNVGRLDAAVPMLYHLNLGAPLVVPGTRVDVGEATTVIREACDAVPDHAVLPEPCEEVTEAVFSHTVAGDEEMARASVTSPDGLRAEIAWSRATLPYLYQWVLPTKGRWALGIEPATAPIFGPDRDAPHAGAPVLAPGQSRRHELSIRVGPSSLWA